MEITAKFGTERLALSAVDDIAQSNIEARMVSLPAPKASLHKTELDHHRNMVIFGLVGAAVGCVWGTLAIPHIAGREVMYTVIVPLSGTYAGLALGCFLAGVRKFVRVNLSRCAEFAPFELIADAPGYAFARAEVVSSESAAKVVDVFARWGAMEFSIDGCVAQPRRTGSARRPASLTRSA